MLKKNTTSQYIPTTPEDKSDINNAIKIGKLETMTEQIVRDMSEIKDGIKELRNSIADLNVNNEKKYISRIEFFAELEPIKKIVYGFVGVILLAVLVGLLALLGLKT